ncbi:MAG: hypothetical protein Q8L39_12590 [Burkholderiales bacterium]|nr:hypothetical protein [Burkholderiales bacterium]
MQGRANYYFVAAFLVSLALAIILGDRIAAHFYPDFAVHLRAKQGMGKAESVALDSMVGHNNGALIRKRSPKEAKSANLFWMGNVEGKGLGIDLLGDASLLASLFPGYGPALYQDEGFWDNYFGSEFGPDSFLQAKPELSRQGFRVAYSWTGCFSIYEKYGADVLILGSSEVYKTLIPEQLAKELGPLFKTPPKVLLCVTHSMPVEAVKLTTQELIRLRGQKPQVVIWGYSFWLAYTRSTKLASYQKDKNREFSDYLARRKYQKERRWYSTQPRFATHSKGADFFPKIGWDDVLDFRLANALSIRAQQGNGGEEGVYVIREIYSQDDAHLSAYLRARLKPFYDITRGISEIDCSMGEAETMFQEAVNELEQLSPNLFVFLAPTSLHHRSTVPECFLPNVKSMLKRVLKKEGTNILVADSEEFGLRDRDFVYPTLDANVFYFDTNHANYFGGQKITGQISSWVKSRWSSSPANASR